MKRIALILALLLTMGRGLFAQQQVQPVNGVLTLNLAPSVNSFKVIIGQAITSVVFQNQSPGGTVTVIFTENATGGFSVTFGGNITNACTVATNANATTVCTFTYDASSNTWIGGGSGGGASPSPVLINQSVDNFNRASLGANWTNWLNSVATTAGPPSFAAGGQGVANNYNVAAWIGTTSVATQRVRVGLLVMGAAGSQGPVLRITGTPTTSVNFYACIESSTAIAIIKVTGAANASAGTTTTLASLSVTGVAGDYLDFGIMGNDLTCVRNGSTATGGGFLQVDDTTPLSNGPPGIFFNASTAPEIGYWTFFNPVMPASGTENIVADGDSIIAANGNGSPATDPATSFLFIPNAKAYVANLGVGGKCLNVGCSAVSAGTLQTMVATGTSVIDPLFVVGAKNIVVLFTANNDIVAGSTPAQVITAMTTYVTNRHSAGWKVVVCQSVSRLGTTTPATDQQETTLAQLISANAMGADAIVNWPYAITAMGASTNTNLFNSDQIHPTELTHIDLLAKVLSAVLGQM